MYVYIFITVKTKCTALILTLHVIAYANDTSFARLTITPRKDEADQLVIGRSTGDRCMWSGKQKTLMRECCPPPFPSLSPNRNRCQVCRGGDPEADCMCTPQIHAHTRTHTNHTVAHTSNDSADTLYKFTSTFMKQIRNLL